MKTSFFLIFFAVVSVIYLAVNYYIFSRGIQAFPAGSQARTWFIVLFWTVASMFLAARFLERIWVCGLTGVITWIGSFWLAFMLYFFLAVVLIDLFRLIYYLLPMPQAFLSGDLQHVRSVLFWSVSGVVAAVVTAGYINARIPAITRLDISVTKRTEGNKILRIAMASDIHLGTIIRKEKANELVEKINSLNPDIILFAGDVVDEDLAPVIRNNIGESLIRLRAPLGVYAVTGNHEFIGGVEPAVKYLTEHGIQFVRDTAILVDGRFYLAGRDDRDKTRFTGRSRKDLKDVLAGADRSCPIILMDHQPFDLDQSAALGVDISLSGHTHHGQLWPFNYITNAMYKVSRGYTRIGTTHFYVSTGFGTWGPPVRLGNRPEIVLINISFQ